MGNLTETISPKRAKTAYTYDKNGELTSQTDPAGNMILYQVDFTEPGSLPSIFGGDNPPDKKIAANYRE